MLGIEGERVIKQFELYFHVLVFYIKNQSINKNQNITTNVLALCIYMYCTTLMVCTSNAVSALYLCS